MREEIEEWRDIKGFESLYEVSNLGRVKSLKFGRERILKPGKDARGYLQVILCKDGKVKKFYVHRLVANTFIPNPNNLETVNHINEIKTDNRVSNLEWMNNKDNVRYSQAVAVNQFTLDGRFIRTWDCMSEIQYQLSFHQSQICSCCQGKYKTAYGFIWRYA